MHTIPVDSLSFLFPDGWSVTKYDDWSYYKNQFSKMRDGIRGVDLIAIDPKKTVWLIEAKDFRTSARINPEPLHEEIWHKVYDTLAALYPAKLLATEDTENDFAKNVCQAKKLRVVFQCEQPQRQSKLFPQSVIFSDIQKKFKTIFKPIDPHALIVTKDNMPTSLQWTVE